MALFSQGYYLEVIHYAMAHYIRRQISNQPYRPNSSTFWSGNSNLLYSFFFDYFQDFLDPVVFTHCCCCPRELNCNLNQKLLFKSVNSLA